MAAIKQTCKDSNKLASWQHKKWVQWQNQCNDNNNSNNSDNYNGHDNCDTAITLQRATTIWTPQLPRQLWLLTATETLQSRSQYFKKPQHICKYNIIATVKFFQNKTETCIQNKLLLRKLVCTRQWPLLPTKLQSECS